MRRHLTDADVEALIAVGHHLLDALLLVHPVLASRVTAIDDDDRRALCVVLDAVDAALARAEAVIARVEELRAGGKDVPLTGSSPNSTVQ